MITQVILDPSPKNQLGKGILAPELEARLLEEGYVFAAFVPPTGPKSPRTMVRCKRFIADAVTDANLDSPRFRERHGGILSIPT